MKIFFRLIVITLFCMLLLFVVNNVKASSAQIKIKIEGGNLSLSHSDTATMSAISLESTSQSSKASLGPITVADNRGTGSGWSVTISATDFKCCNNVYTIPVRNLTIDPGSLKVIQGSSTGINTYQSKVFASEEDILTLISANQNSGMGSYEITPILNLAIPQDSIAGEYAATLTITVI